jgi:predicted ABC-type ATPase
MNLGIPRLRMFAGPNGSGKSTFKSMIRKELLGVYINPDDIEKEIKDYGFLDLAAYRVSILIVKELSFFCTNPHSFYQSPEVPFRAERLLYAINSYHLI